MVDDGQRCDRFMMIRKEFSYVVQVFDFSEDVFDVQIKLFMKKAQHLRRRLRTQCAFVLIKPWNGTQLHAMHTISEFTAIEGVVCLGHKTPQKSFHEKRYS